MLVPLKKGLAALLLLSLFSTFATGNNNFQGEGEDAAAAAESDVSPQKNKIQDRMLNKFMGGSKADGAEKKDEASSSVTFTTSTSDAVVPEKMETDAIENDVFADYDNENNATNKLTSPYPYDEWGYDINATKWLNNSKWDTSLNCTYDNNWCFQPQISEESCDRENNLEVNIEFSGASGNNHSVFSTATSAPSASCAAGIGSVVGISSASIEIRTKDINGTMIDSTPLRKFFRAALPTKGFLLEDPRVVYDSFEDRFLAVAAMTTDTESKLFVAVSKTEFPMTCSEADWFYLSLKVNGDGTERISYPGVAVDEEAIYLTGAFYNTARMKEQRDMFIESRLFVMDKLEFYDQAPEVGPLPDPQEVPEGVTFRDLLGQAMVLSPMDATVKYQEEANYWNETSRFLKSVTVLEPRDGSLEWARNEIYMPAEIRSFSSQDVSGDSFGTYLVSYVWNAMPGQKVPDNVTLPFLHIFRIENPLNLTTADNLPPDNGSMMSIGLEMNDIVDDNIDIALPNVTQPATR